MQTSHPDRAPQVKASSIALQWPGRLSGHRYLIVSALLFAAMALRTSYGQWSGDFWEHSAVVRELAAHPLNPSHPLLNVQVAHPFFSPYLLMVAVAARELSIPPITALGLAGLANLVLLLTGLWHLIRTLFDRDPHIISFYALLLILFAWPASAWFWSGFFHFGVLGYVLPYPSSFAMGLTLIILAEFPRALRGGHPSRHVLLAVLTGIVVLTHLPTALVTFIGVGALALRETRRPDVRALLLGAAVLTGALAFALLWPYYPLWALVSNSDADFHVRSYVLYSGVGALWPTFLLLPIAWPALAAQVSRRRTDALGVMLAGVLLVYVTGYLTAQYGLGRIISFAAILIEIGAAATIARWETSSLAGHTWRPPALMLALGALSVNAPTIAELGDISLAAQGRRYDYNEYLAIGQRLKGDAVVLTDLRTGWILPTFGGKVIASPHPAHWVSDNGQRRADVNRFFAAATTTAERRAMIDTYGVDFVLINSLHTPDSDRYRVLGETTKATTNLRLIAVARKPPGS